MRKKERQPCRRLYLIFLHGFLVLSDEAEFVYKCDDFYHPEDEVGVAWNDPKIGIKWPIENIDEIKLSEKDKNNPLLEEVSEY